ncbi:MAG: cation:proton antiporter [Candidatus Bathyarchaeota archaeon]|nr:cation:proton antiporter [Candidatus Bathyarchaeota archaeon]
MINAEGLLLLISATLFLSYISGIIYSRTKIPDLVWVLLFGILLGPILGVFDAELFLNVFDLMILVTVALFAFNTGISFNIQHILGNTTRAFNMALGTFLVITASVGFTLNFLLPESFNLVTGFLLGAMISGIDGISISSLLGSLGRESKGFGESGLFLQLESTLADPIKVVGVSTIIKMILLTGAGPRTAARDILFTLIVSTLIGVGTGLFWGEIITRLRDRPLNYMMTIAALFPIYVISEALSDGGGGPISVFLFGAVLMNYGYVTKSLRMNRRSRIDRRQIKEYHDEITFLIKSMFFVYMGLVMEFEIRYLAISFILTALLIVIRYLVATIIGYTQGISKEQIAYTRIFFILGPSSLVLTQYVAEYDPNGLIFPDTQLYGSIVLPIVLFSIIFASIIGPMVARKQSTPKPEPDVNKEESTETQELSEKESEKKKNGKKKKEA